jgi:uncharacterized membrane protein
MSDDFQTTPPAPEMPPSAPVPPAPAPAGDAGGPMNDTSKILAALGYVFWPVALVAILLDPYKNEKWVRAHAIQALALGVAIWIATAVLTFVFPINMVISIAGFVYQIILAVKAWNGESVQIPVIYGIVEQYI